MAMADQEYLKFGKPANRCTACGADLSHAERHASVLPGSTESPDVPDAVTDDDGIVLHREDYCSDCWERLRDEGYFSFWVAKRAPAAGDSRRARKARKARLLELFLQIDDLRRGETDSEDLENSLGLGELATKAREERLQTFRSVLAHLLLHERVFQLQGTDNPDPGWITFTSPLLERSFAVRELDLAAPDADEAKAFLDKEFSALTDAPNPGE